MPATGACGKSAQPSTMVSHNRNVDSAEATAHACLLPHTKGTQQWRKKNLQIRCCVRTFVSKVLLNF